MPTAASGWPNRGSHPSFPCGGLGHHVLPPRRMSRKPGWDMGAPDGSLTSCVSELAPQEMFVEFPLQVILCSWGYSCDLNRTPILVSLWECGESVKQWVSDAGSNMSDSIVVKEVSYPGLSSVIECPASPRSLYVRGRCVCWGDHWAFHKESWGELLQMNKAANEYLGMLKYTWHCSLTYVV